MNLEHLLKNSRMLQLTCGDHSVRIRPHAFKKGQYFITSRKVSSTNETSYSLPNIEQVDAFLVKFMENNNE
jgi:hypothetical protein